MIDKITKLAQQFELMALSAETTGKEDKNSAREKKEKVPPKTSDIKELLLNLDKLETFNAKKEYAEKCLKQISSGSSRIVFTMPDNMVLKLAFNEKGLAQNKAESSIKEKSKYINPVVRASSNYSWIITPLADKITERQFFDLTGINFKEFGECIKYIMRELSTKERKKPEDFEQISKEDIVKQISEIGLKYKLMPGDIARISSWKVRDDVPVLVDLGLTQDIYKKFYAKKPKNS